MPSLVLPHGTVDYRAAGPADADSPPVVFVHGALVDATLWTGVADALAARGVRSYAPDLPLGSHRTPLSESADQTPRGVARQLLAFVEALELSDVTLVGNDTGGALCQFAIDTDASRIGRVVLTNCDAFSTFPPEPFATMFKALRTPAALHAGMLPMRAKAMRHSPAGFGVLARRLDAEQTRAWVEPSLRSAEVRRDFTRLLKAVDPSELEGVSSRLGSFNGPALLIWGTGDRFFKLALGERLAQTFADARLVKVEGGKTFLPIDEPERVADEIASAFYAGTSSDAGIAPAGITPGKENSRSAS